MTPMHRTAMIAAAVAATAAVAPLAAAAPTAPATSCPDLPASQIFAPWGDQLLYSLVPGGDFEGALVGWEAVGGSVVADGVNTLGVGPDANSYRLPEGRTLTTAPTCVTKDSIYARFITKTIGLPKKGAPSLRTDILWQNARGQWKPVANATTGFVSGWDASPRVATSADVRLGDGETANIRVKFTATRGTWGIDDVYVDPRMR